MTGMTAMSATLLGPVLVESALKGAVIFTVAAVVAWSLRRRPASIRHGVWAAALALQLALPVLAIMMPTWRVPLLPARIADSAAAVTTMAASSAAITVPPETRADESVAKDVAMKSARSGAGDSRDHASLPAAVDSSRGLLARWDISPGLWLATLWLLGCLAVLARLAAGTAHVSRMAVQGERVVDGEWLSLISRLADRLGIRRPLTLLRGNRLGVPVTWGIVYPVVLLPEDADGWPEDRRRYVLVHEMAHVKRLDALTQLVGQLTLALFWFNPLTWLAARRLVVEREHACDDYVLRHGTKPSEYASDLLEMVRAIGTAGRGAAEPAFAALAMARRSEFEGRMLSILDPHLDRQPISRTGAVMSIIASLVVALPLAAFSPYARAAAAAPDATMQIGARPAPAAGAPLAAPRAVAARPARPSRTASVNWTGTCDTANLSRTGTSNHVEVHNGDGSAFTEYVFQGSGRCVEARIMGQFTTTDDETDITSIPMGSIAFFRERTAAGDRQLRIMTNADGVLERTYSVNGQSAPYDADAARWFNAYLPGVMAEAGINTPQRVARVRARGGVPAVLSLIGSLRGSGARRDHYTALIDAGRLSGDDIERVLRQARRDVTSSGDLTAILERLPLRGAQGEQVASALADAIGGISSDGDKANAVTHIVMQSPGDPEVLLAAMHAARTIESDGDKANFLITAAAKYLTARNAALRDAYFEVADSVESDGDHANVLITAAPYGHADEGVTLAVIRSAMTIESDGDKANVLIMIAGQHLLTSKAVREEFLRTAATVQSSGDRANVLSAAIQQ